MVDSSSAQAEASKSIKKNTPQKISTPMESNEEPIITPLVEENKLLNQPNKTSNHSEDTPPNPRAGECYARVFTPQKTETFTEQVTLKEATKALSIVPATYQVFDETVVVSEASKKLVVIPATYKTISEEIIVKPESTKLEVVPAIYTEKSKTIVVKEASTQWKRGRAWLGKALATKNGDSTANNGAVDDEVMCLVEVPAVTKVLTTRVEASPASTREIKIPAVTKTITKTVLDQPATTQEVDVPAVSKTIKVTKLVTPAKEVVVDVPAEYGSVTKTRVISEGGSEWRSILCETNATPTKILALQNALSKAGFNPGPIDGVIKTQTMNAVNSYQRSKNLPIDKYINMETVRALGL